MRKTADITITAEGRDKGKIYRLTEKDAFSAERWVMRLMRAAQLPLESFSGGPEQMAVMGILGGTRGDIADVDWLLDEMMTCIQIVPDSRHADMVRALVPDDIEEVKTLAQLRDEVLHLHLGFSPLAIISGLISRLTTPVDSPKPKTSPRQSRRSSKAS